MDITIYASDVRNFDDEVERHFNVEEWFGHNLFDEDDRLSLDKYEYAVDPRTYLSIMIDMQEQIHDLRSQIELQKKWIKNREEVEKWDGSMLK